MPIVFRLAGYLSAFTEGKKRVAVDASAATVRDALDSLGDLYPGIRDRVLTEMGQVRQHVNIFVGAESIRYTGGLATRIQDGAEVSIIAAISGG